MEVIISLEIFRFDIFRHKLKSCSEMEKELGKAAFDALLGGLVSQGEGALTLVPETDSRPEYNSGEAALGDLLD